MHDNKKIILVYQFTNSIFHLLHRENIPCAVGSRLLHKFSRSIASHFNCLVDCRWKTGQFVTGSVKALSVFQIICAWPSSIENGTKLKFGHLALLIIHGSISEKF